MNLKLNLTKTIKLFSIFVLLIVVILGLKHINNIPVVQAVVAEATIKVHVKNNLGQSMANVSVVCTQKTGSNAPHYYYLKTNSSGYTNLSIFPNGNDVFKCYLSKSAYCINNRYFYRDVYSTGNFTLNPGDIKTYTLSYRFIKYCNQPKKHYAPKPTPKLTSKSEPKAPISKIKLPIKLTKQNIKLSSLNLTVKQAKSVKNFTIQKTLTTQIKFIEPLDLSSPDVAEKFQNLDKYIQIQPERVFIDSKNLPWLNKKTQITFYNVKLAKKPSKITILRIDGPNVKPLDPIKNNIKYDSKKQELSFIVNGFSEYVLTPSLEPNIKIMQEFNGLAHYLIISSRVGDLTSVINVSLKENSNIACKNIMPNANGDWTCKLKLPNKKLDDTIVIKANNVAQFPENIELPLHIHYFTKNTSLSTKNINVNIFDNWIYYVSAGVIATSLVTAIYFIVKRKK